MVGVARFTLKPVDGSGKKIIYYDDSADDSCNDLASNNEIAFCIDVAKEKNTLGLEAIGVNEKNILWGKNCVVPN